MIHKSDIESKDFSLEVPNIISKLRALGSSLMNSGFSKDPVMDEECCLGYAMFLGEIVDDLRVINDALYGENEEDPAVIQKEGAEAP